VADAWIKAQAYRLHTFGTVTRLTGGGELGAESSVTKVFWSDLDVALHQTALYVALGTTAVVMALPAFWMLSTALKPESLVFQIPPAAAAGRAGMVDRSRISFSMWARADAQPDR